MKKISLTTKFAVMVTIILWASAFVGIRAGLAGYSPGALALLRFIAAGMSMVVVYFSMSKRTTIAKRDIFYLLILGAITLGGYHAALNFGEQSIPAGPASFIISQSPVITTLLAIIFLGERLKIRGIIGMIISVLGICVILSGHRAELSWDIGNLYVLIAMMLGSLYSVLQKYFLDKYSIIEVTSWMMWGGVLALLIYTPQLLTEIHTASWAATAWGVYLGIFPAAVAAVGWSYVLKRMPASRAVNFLYFLPLVTTILGWLILGEFPQMLSLLGGLIALVGVYVLNQSYKQTAPAVVNADG